ncbi:hypothetical protein P5V15_003611 [Pogonomyrmex californicus]
MADIKQEYKGEDVDSGMGNSADPKNMQELTQYVQTLLQNMQDKFQTMSDQIIGRNILFLAFLLNLEQCMRRRVRLKQHLEVSRIILLCVEYCVTDCGNMC